MTRNTNMIKRAATTIALTAALAALAVPSALANGSDGDRATSKPAVVGNAAGMGSLGDRATSGAVVIDQDGMGSLGDRATSGTVAVVNPDGMGSVGDRATSKPVSSAPLSAPVVGIAAPSGFDLEAFGIGAVTMLGLIALLAVGGSRLRAIRQHGLHGA
jgi:hypothetical protein